MNYSLLADIIVVIHFAYACFVLFGFIAIVIGAWCSWSWIKNFPFRIIHLICTIFVPLETILSMTCPLTTLENYFLKASGASGYQRSFIGNLAGKILFYDAPEWVFAVIYFSLAIMVIFYFFRFPPEQIKKLNHREHRETQG